MTEVIDRALSIPEPLYARIGQRSVERAGVGFIDFAQQQPEGAYLTIVDFVLANTTGIEAVLDKNGEQIATQKSDGAGVDAIARDELKKHFLRDVVGQEVRVSVSVLTKPGLLRRLTGRPPKRDEVLTFNADFSKIDPDAINELFK
jgi:hypothetical protein